MSKHKNQNVREPHQKHIPPTMTCLRTIQEQQLEDIAMTNAKPPKSKAAQIKYNDLDDEQELIINTSVAELKDTSTDKISAAISELIAKNKISAKNAFQVPMIHLKQTKEYNSLSGDNNWKKISSTLDSNNKIYGYRVDATHSHTYKVLELLTRQEKQNKNTKEEQALREEAQTNFLRLDNQEDSGDEVLFKYLQKNYKAINIVHLQVFFNVNPILEKTKRIFDQQGLRALLLNNIEIESNLLLKLTFQPCNQQHQTFTYSGQQEAQTPQRSQIGQTKTLYLPQIAQSMRCDEVGNTDNIFANIYRVCCLNDQLSKQPEEAQLLKRQDNEIDMMWKQLEILSLHKLQGPHHKQMDLNQQMFKADEAQQLQEQINRQCNEVRGANSSQVQKQYLSSEKKYSLAVQTQNERSLNSAIIAGSRISLQIDVQTSKILEPSLQVTTEERLSLQIESSNNNNAQSAYDQKKEVADRQQYKAKIGQVSQLLPENTPLTNELEITKTYIVSNPQISAARQIPINQVIRLSRKIKNTGIVLKPMEAVEQHYKDESRGNIVETWKNGANKTKTPRKSKKTVQKDKEQINFLEEQTQSGKKLRQKILRIDKVRKLEFKKFIKDINTQKMVEQYLYIDTLKYKFDFKLTTIYREDHPTQEQLGLDPNEQAQKTSFEANTAGNQSSYVELLDQNSSSQTKTVSLKYVKHKIHSLIFQQKMDSFADIYYSFISLQGYITPALCFLTILHLTNENAFRLQSSNHDIRIVREESPAL